jgi:hypothetical protein
MYLKIRKNSYKMKPKKVKMILYISMDEDSKIHLGHKYELLIVGIYGYLCNYR